MKNELQLIDANLISVINQFELDYNKNVNHTHDLLKKNTFKLKESIIIKEKNLKQLEDSTALKNDLLTSRYEQNEQRISHQLKEKQTSYIESREKKNLLYNKRLSNYDTELKATYEKHILELKENKENAEAAVKKLESTEQKNYLRDVKDSKRSYKFKQRTLKL